MFKSKIFKCNIHLEKLKLHKCSVRKIFRVVAPTHPASNQETEHY